MPTQIRAASNLFGCNSPVRYMAVTAWWHSMAVYSLVNVPNEHDPAAMSATSLNNEKIRSKKWVQKWAKNS